MLETQPEDYSTLDSMKKIKTIVSPLAKISLLENGLVFSDFTEKILEDVSLMEEQVRLVRAHFGSGLYMISDLSRTKRVSNAMRKYCASEEALSDLHRSALIVGSGVSRIAGNLYLTFNKPVIPIKLFTDFEKAQAWLLEEQEQLKSKER